MTNDFPWLKTLIIALIGALIGQILSWFFNWIKRKIDFNKKKKMIINDLLSQVKVLDLLTEKYLELKKILENKETDTFTSCIFHTLHLDIYQSVLKSELYEIFDKKLFLLVDIYKSIEFIKQHSPYEVYSDYLKKSELHLEEKKDDPNHEKYCSREMGFIENALKNIDNHLKTVVEIKLDVKNLIG